MFKKLEKWEVLGVSSLVEVELRSVGCKGAGCGAGQLFLRWICC